MRKKESFRWRIFIYNIILLTMVSVVCTMYYMLNDQTLNIYNQTFTSYNEINHIYDRINEMQTLYKTSLQDPMLEPKETFENIKRECDVSIQIMLDNAIQTQEKTSLLTLKQNIEVFYIKIIQNNPVVETTQSIHQSYLDIMKARGDYYGLVTKNMQQYKQEVSENRDQLAWMSTLMVIFIILWIIYFSKTMIDSITNPIDCIIHNINQIKTGTYDLTQISNTNEEMSVLCYALEDMAKSVQDNIRNEKEKIEFEKRFLEQQNESLRKDELLAQGELKILQNQVNPHFLFNTLNLIYKKAYCEGAIETSELMEKTSQLLRYSLDNANKISTLDNEIKAVENYMYIQDKRFGERIHFRLYRQKGVQNFSIPTMILQPLVENAIVHGCKDVIENGEVMVSISKVGAVFILSIRDNGLGMREEDVKALLQHDFQVIDKHRVHVGLYNITRRLRSFFKDRIQIEIISSENNGFEIRLIIQGEEVYV